MNKNIFFTLIGIFINSFVFSQMVSIFNNVPFYSMYHYLEEGQTLPPEAYTQIPPDAIRLHAYERDIISRKLSDSEISSIGSNLTLNVIIKAACDNYDRLAGVNLVLAPKGSTSYTYDQDNIKRLEIARFITPFMNKNISPEIVPYSFKIDNISNILHDKSLSSIYDFWIEFRADGYSAAANTQVSGCKDRTDVFRGDLEFVSSGDVIESENHLLPLSYRYAFNNYNATDVPGQTTRLLNFTVEKPIENAILHLITSNHGAGNNGEEYVRRVHYVYFDENMIYEYEPGGKNCEDYRKYNTQLNGIYGRNPRTLRGWISWNNWCPGDKIPNREINLGNISAGTHTIKLNVPTAVFEEESGNFPISMYIQNSKSGQIICSEPTNFKIKNQEGQNATLSWTESGTSKNWETLWGKDNHYNENDEFFQNIKDSPEDSQTNLMQDWQYESYVKSKCSNDLSSNWVGPIFPKIISLKTGENSIPKVSVFPNPTNDIVNIDSDLKLLKVSFFSFDGKKLLENNSSKINISQLISGVYFIKIDFIDGSSSIQKIVKK